MQTFVARLLGILSLFGGMAGVRAADMLPVRDLPTTVRGFGETAEAARIEAYSKARLVFLEYLAANYADISAQPSVDWLRERRVIAVVHDPIQEFQNGLYSVEMKVYRPSSAQLAELREQSRIPWMFLRHRQAGLVLGGIVVALLVLLGLLRFDEATRGRYGIPLLALVAALATAVGVAVWWSL